MDTITDRMIIDAIIDLPIRSRLRILQGLELVEQWQRDYLSTLIKTRKIFDHDHIIERTISELAEIAILKDLIKEWTML